MFRLWEKRFAGYCFFLYNFTMPGVNRFCLIPARCKMDLSPILSAQFSKIKGFIWIATWEGLSKYDGYRFTNFSKANGLSHNQELTSLLIRQG